MKASDLNQGTFFHLEGDDRLFMFRGLHARYRPAAEGKPEHVAHWNTIDCEGKEFHVGGDVDVDVLRLNADEQAAWDSGIADANSAIRRKEREEALHEFVYETAVKLFENLLEQPPDGFNLFTLAAHWVNEPAMNAALYATKAERALEPHDEDGKQIIRVASRPAASVTVEIPKELLWST